jgi:adenosylcobyric acid synthase
MSARVLMVQGTASSVGKSLLVCALCRVYARRGLRVAPFKSQNMSNNASAIGEGREIGRAQALQAVAARIAPSVDMNPILLKPETDRRSQVVVLGKPWKSLGATEYYAQRALLWETATASLDRLRDGVDLVVIEGAGSPAEINLRESDIVNMSIALYAQAPVLLVGDIDPGGVFAQFAGTLSLISPQERDLVKGLIVNKFRGELSLLEPGLRMIEDICGKPVLGVLPYLNDIGLAEEDAQPLERGGAKGAAAEGIDIAVIHYPRISNFDDIDALRLEPGVRARFVRRAAELGRPDAIILPGSKASAADLEWLRAEGLLDGIRWLARLGVPVAGICGGYQMLGMSIDDSEGIEGAPRRIPGIGLLQVETRLEKEKNVGKRKGRALGGPGFLSRAVGMEVEGYEIHSGDTKPVDPHAPPLLELFSEGAGASRTQDGAASADGAVWGCYLHGIFDLPAFRAAWIGFVAERSAGGNAFSSAERGSPGLSLSQAREAALDRLADCVEERLDMNSISRIIEG